MASGAKPNELSHRNWAHGAVENAEHIRQRMKYRDSARLKPSRRLMAARKQRRIDAKRVGHLVVVDRVSDKQDGRRIDVGLVQPAAAVFHF